MSSRSQINLFDPSQLTPTIPTGSIDLAALPSTVLKIPAGIVPPAQDCNGSTILEPTVVMGPVPGLSGGVAPGEIRYGSRAITIDRLEAAAPSQTGPQTDSIGIALSGLTLRSQDLVDLSMFGLTGSDFLFLVLGPGSHTGTMDFDFAMRTFQAAVEADLELRVGSIDGPFVGAFSDTLQTGVVPWDVALPEGVAAGYAEDAFFAGVVAGAATSFELSGSYLQIAASLPTVPEPGALAVLLVLGIAAVSRWA